MPRLVAAFCLSSLLAALAPSNAVATGLPAVTTHRSVNAFRDCFIASQEQAKRPWAYVLNGDSGGTFSTVPVDGVDSPYLLSVRDRDGARRISLSGEAASGSGADDRCCRGWVPPLKGDMADDLFNLQRFVDAQSNGVYETALAELRGGDGSTIIQ